jgi:hypothetical protein
MNEIEANQLIVAVNKGQLNFYGIQKVKIKKYIPIEYGNLHLSQGIGNRIRHYKRLLSSGDVMKML